MTVSSSTNRASYSGNGSTTVFAYNFKIFDQDDLTVILRAADGTETTQTITTHYTVSGVGSVSGGNVTFVTAPASGVTVVILREQPLTQGLDLVANDPFPSASFEDQLDKLTFMVQQHDEELGRAIKASKTNTLTGSEFTISAADRANKVFSFDSSGDLSVTQELGTFRGDWAASTAYVERDLVRDSSDGSIYIVTSAHTSSGSTPLDTNTNSSKYDAIFDVGAMIAGTVTMTGDLTVQGNTTLGNASSDSITMTGTAANLRMSTTNVTDILDEDTMSSDSATALATQQSIKAYVDSQVGASDTLTEILGNGNTTSGANIQLTTTDELQFRDTALKISSSVDGQLDIDADTEIEITAPTVDINASTEVNISADLSVDTDTLHVDSTNDRVGINTTNPDRDLTVIGTGHFGATTAGVTLSNTSNVGVIYGMTSTGALTDLQITSVGASSHLYFDADGTIGINNTSPNDWVSTGTNFVIGSGGGHNGMTIASGSTSYGTIYFADGTIGDALDAGYIRYHHQYDRMSFVTSSSYIDAIRITNAGDVGIGLTGDPSTKLEVNGTVTATGGAFTGDVTFGDNDKAIFGAGSDLSIFHDGSNSKISDSGTGNLHILADNEVYIANAGNSEYKARFITDGAVELYYDAAKKFETTSTGIDVTGTVTADGLTVEGTALEATFAGSTSSTIHIKGDTSNSGDANEEDATLRMSTDNGAFHHRISALNGAGQAPMQFTHFNGTADNKTLTIGANGDISFYEDTGTTPKFFWDASAESLGIGTTSPDAGNDIHIKPSSGNAVFALEGNAAEWWKIIGGTDSKLYFQNETDSNVMVLNNGNVGIGTTSPISALEVNVNGTSAITVRSSDGGQANLIFGDQADGDRGRIVYSNADESLRFAVNNLQEAMRIDSSGNLLVGKTAAGTATTGFQTGSDGFTGITRSANPPLRINRKTDDGTIIDIRKDNTTVGVIGSSYGDRINIGTGNTGIMFRTSSRSIDPADPSTGLITDNLIGLGRSGVRFKDLYLSGGVFLGGTTSANHLTDYEEGTFTANYSATGLTVTHDITTGKYTKVGNLVTFYILLGTDAISGEGAVQLNITGLPFAPASAGLGSGGAGLAYGFASNENNVKWTIASGGTLNLWDGDSNTAGVFSSNKLATGANKNRLNIIGHYYTA